MNSEWCEWERLGSRNICWPVRLACGLGMPESVTWYTVLRLCVVDLYSTWYMVLRPQCVVQWSSLAITVHAQGDICILTTYVSWNLNQLDSVYHTPKIPNCCGC